MGMLDLGMVVGILHIDRELNLEEERCAHISATFDVH